MKMIYKVVLVDIAKQAEIAIPAIGTAVFKFPKELSVSIMAAGFRQCFEKLTSAQTVRICATDPDAKALFDRTFFAA